MASSTHAQQPVALVTGGSRGLGRALVAALVQRGWAVITDARDPARLAAAVGNQSDVTALAGDVSDAEHRRELVAAVDGAGRLDLLINNASILGPSPLPALADVDASVLAEVLRVNAAAPVALFGAVRPVLDASGGVVINITSDAAHGPWPGWGVYGASKAALEQLSRVLAAEHPSLAIYAVDPGDLRTAMHQDAFPGEDISDRPAPETAVPAILSLLDTRPASGRYAVADLVGAPS